MANVFVLRPILRLKIDVLSVQTTVITINQLVNVYAIKVTQSTTVNAYPVVQPTVNGILKADSVYVIQGMSNPMVYVIWIVLLGVHGAKPLKVVSVTLLTTT